MGEEEWAWQTVNKTPECLRVLPDSSSSFLFLSFHLSRSVILSTRIPLRPACASPVPTAPPRLRCPCASFFWLLLLLLLLCFVGSLTTTSAVFAPSFPYSKRGDRWWCSAASQTQWGTSSPPSDLPFTGWFCFKQSPRVGVCVCVCAYEFTVFGLFASASPPPCVRVCIFASAGWCFQASPGEAARRRDTELRSAPPINPCRDTG